MPPMPTSVQSSSASSESGAKGSQPDAAFLNAFVESVESVFQMMLDTEPTRQAIQIPEKAQSEPTVTAIIGISGELECVLLLRFPLPTAMSLAGRFIGAEPGSVNEEVVDAISELANMIAGSAKAKFNTVRPLELSLPTVVQGDEFWVRTPRKAVWLDVPFTSDAGDFILSITYTPN